MANVLVYYFEGCPFCKNAFAWLDNNKIPYDKILVERDDQKKRQELEQKSGMRTFPQIFNTKGELVGGYSELSKVSPEDL